MTRSRIVTALANGAEGRFAQVPLAVSCRPRWWMEVNLTLEDAADAPAPVDGVER